MVMYFSVFVETTDLQEHFKVCIVQISTLSFKDWIKGWAFLKFFKSYICEQK